MTKSSKEVEKNRAIVGWTGSGSSKHRKIIDHVVYQVNEDWRTKDGKKLRRSYYDVVDYEK